MTAVTTNEADLMGIAIKAYYEQGANDAIHVYSDLAKPETISPVYLYRSFSEMPGVEQLALKNSYGAILDVGAGAGIHAQWLADQGHPVTALEASPAACQVLKQTNSFTTVHGNAFHYDPSHQFDTILLLMNGIGICGSLDGLSQLLLTMRAWLNPDGQILLDSTDLRPLMGTALASEREAETGEYYGIIHYQLTYGSHIGTPFEWLFTDWPTLNSYAEDAGFQAHCIFYGTDHHYLARLQLTPSYQNLLFA